MIGDSHKDFRQELKYVVPAKSYHRALHWILHNSAHFYMEYPDRQVNSIYFDSYNYDAYKDNLAGIASRKKIRYRWYGDSLFPVQGALEFKYKRNHLCKKVICKVKDIDIQENASWSSIRRDIMDRLPDDVCHHLNRNPLSALINRYQRAYFRSKQSDIRITLDSTLIFHKQGGTFPNYTRKIHLPDMNILEIKFPSDFRNNVLEIMSDFQFPVARFSKYCVGILSTT